MTDKVSILIQFADNISDHIYPRLNLRLFFLMRIWHGWNVNFETYFLQLFLSPWKPAFFWITSPTMDDKNSSHMHDTNIINIREPYTFKNSVLSTCNKCRMYCA